MVQRNQYDARTNHRDCTCRERQAPCSPGAGPSLRRTRKLAAGAAKHTLIEILTGLLDRAAPVQRGERRVLSRVTRIRGAYSHPSIPARSFATA
jgi:hypothetical protein